MTDFHKFLSLEAHDVTYSEIIREADATLERFTFAFNAADTDGMDEELHFPHVMYSAGQLLVWKSPGMHPQDFFEVLRATGWAETKYEEKKPVLVSKDKVHFVVIYSRKDSFGRVLSIHTNLWVVTRVAEKWGIALRSY